MNDGMGRDIVCNEKGAGPLVTLGAGFCAREGWKVLTRCKRVGPIEKRQWS